MPTVNTDLQRKYRYKVAININADDGPGTPYSEVPVDEFTPPDRRREPVTRQNRALGQISLVGLPSYGEMTIRLALRVVGDGSNDTAALIADLEQLHASDTDTCLITLMTLADVDGGEQVSYEQTFSNCRLTGYKIDALNRKGDDDMLHVELTLMPSGVQLIKGTQIGI